MIYANGQPTAEFVPEIADNLTTDDSTKALSAKQGKVLNEKIDSITNKNEVVAIPNIGQHKSIRITLADTDTFCVATFAGAIGKNAMYFLANQSNVSVFQNGYSITRDSNLVFTITSTDYWTRGLLQVFAPNPNAVSYEILN